MNRAVSFNLDKVEVNPLEHTLSSGEKVVSLQPKFIEVLIFLAEQQPELLTRQQIIDHVWDGNGYVGEKALTNAIWHLRKTLKELDAEQDFIETVRKSGYRLLIKPSYSNESVLPSTVNISTHNIKRIIVICFFFISIFLAWYWWPKTPDTYYSEPSLLTQYPGRELFPNVSDDGRYLVYSWRQMDRQIDLYLKDLEQPDLPHRNLTHSEGRESRSDWSPDGSELFYYVRHDKHCEIVGLKMADMRLQKYGECSRGSSDVAVSPNGKWLAYVGVDEQNRTRGVYLKALSSSSPAERIDCETCVKGASEAIDFSEDSNRIAISKNLDNGNEDIFIYNIEKQEEVRVVTGNPDIRGLAWMPNSEKIAYSAVKHGKRHAFLLDLLSGENKNLNIEGFSYPEFDKQQNLYYHDWKIDTSIMRLELDSEVASSPFPLIQSEFNFRYPDYSESQNKVALISNESGFDEVWLSTLDGATRTQLTQLKIHAEHPVWSPDGKQIAFKANNGNESRLYVVDVVSGQTTHIKSTLGNYSKPRWSLDNRALYTSYNGNIYQIEVETGLARKITRGSHAIETAENGLIVYKSGAGLWQVDHKAEQIIERPLVENIKLPSSTGWYATETGIYYFKVNLHDYRLSYYDFATKQYTDMLRVPERSFSRSSGMGFVPSKKWLLFTGYESPQVDIKVVKKTTSLRN